ncbi:hypothetical protein PCE1_000399 [Barthelona sp. PCE]
MSSPVDPIAIDDFNRNSNQLNIIDSPHTSIIETNIKSTPKSIEGDNVTFAETLIEAEKDVGGIQSRENGFGDALQTVGLRALAGFKGGGATSSITKALPILNSIMSTISQWFVGFAIQLPLLMGSIGIDLTDVNDFLARVIVPIYNYAVKIMDIVKVPIKAIDPIWASAVVALFLMSLTFWVSIWFQFLIKYGCSIALITKKSKYFWHWIWFRVLYYGTLFLLSILSSTWTAGFTELENGEVANITRVINLVSLLLTLFLLGPSMIAITSFPSHKFAKSSFTFLTQIFAGFGSVYRLLRSAFGFMIREKRSGCIMWILSRATNLLAFALIFINLLVLYLFSGVTLILWAAFKSIPLIFGVWTVKNRKVSLLERSDGLGRHIRKIEKELRKAMGVRQYRNMTNIQIEHAREQEEKEEQKANSQTATTAISKAWGITLLLSFIVLAAGLGSGIIYLVIPYILFIVFFTFFFVRMVSDLSMKKLGVSPTVTSWAALASNVDQESEMLEVETTTRALIWAALPGGNIIALTTRWLSTPPFQIRSSAPLVGVQRSPFSWFMGFMSCLVYILFFVLQDPDNMKLSTMGIFTAFLFISRFAFFNNKSRLKLGLLMDSAQRRSMTKRLAPQYRQYVSEAIDDVEKQYDLNFYNKYAHLFADQNLILQAPIVDDNLLHDEIAAACIRTVTELNGKNHLKSKHKVYLEDDLRKFFSLPQDMRKKYQKKVGIVSHVEGDRLVQYFLAGNKPQYEDIKNTFTDYYIALSEQAGVSLPTVLALVRILGLTYRVPMSVIHTTGYIGYLSVINSPSSYVSILPNVDANGLEIDEQFFMNKDVRIILGDFIAMSMNHLSVSPINDVLGPAVMKDYALYNTFSKVVNSKVFVKPQSIYNSELVAKKDIVEAPTLDASVFPNQASVIDVQLKLGVVLNIWADSVSKLRYNHTLPSLTIASLPYVQNSCMGSLYQLTTDQERASLATRGLCESLLIIHDVNNHGYYLENCVREWYMYAAACMNNVDIGFAVSPFINLFLHIAIYDGSEAFVKQLNKLVDFKKWFIPNLTDPFVIPDDVYEAELERTKGRTKMKKDSVILQATVELQTSRDAGYMFDYVWNLSQSKERDEVILAVENALVYFDADFSKGIHPLAAALNESEARMTGFNATKSRLNVR